MKYCAAFCVIDLLSDEHGIDRGFHFRFFSQGNHPVEHFLIDDVLREVDEDVLEL